MTWIGNPASGIVPALRAVQGFFFALFVLDTLCFVHCGGVSGDLTTPLMIFLNGTRTLLPNSCAAV